jgi:hypothetical protein
VIATVASDVGRRLNFPFTTVGSGDCRIQGDASIAEAVPSLACLPPDTK